MAGYLYKVFHPEIFQGTRKSRRYFEGWYFKLTSPEQGVLALIPGVAMDASGAKHAFIQVIDGSTAETHYLTYPFESFKAHDRAFEVELAGNRFSTTEVTVDLRPQGLNLHGSLTLVNPTPLPSSVRMPGVMGWYGYLPIMECYHGLVSLDHGLEGTLHWKAREMDFTGGRGYTEKDWGTSFPRAYVWTQCNHFEQPGVSVMISVAHIPWMGSYFVGFLGLVLVYGQIFRFTTYTGAKIRTAELHGQHLILELADGNHTLRLETRGARAGILKAPHLGNMKREIAESIDAEVHIRLSTRKGKEVFSGTGKHAGLELVGPIHDLLRSEK